LEKLKIQKLCGLQSISIAIELDVYSNAGENDNKLTEYPETLLENTEHRTSPLSPPAKQQNNIATLRAHTGHW
jgi:hypothetical protein